LYLLDCKYSSISAFKFLAATSASVEELSLAEEANRFAELLVAEI